VLLISQRTGWPISARRQAALLANGWERLLNFANHFSRHSTATFVSVITTGDFARFVYTIAARRMTDTEILHLARWPRPQRHADLCGRGFLQRW